MINRMISVVGALFLGILAFSSSFSWAGTLEHIEELAKTKDHTRKLELIALISRDEDAWSTLWWNTENFDVADFKALLAAIESAINLTDVDGKALETTTYNIVLLAGVAAQNLDVMPVLPNTARAFAVALHNRQNPQNSHDPIQDSLNSIAKIFAAAMQVFFDNKRGPELLAQLLPQFTSTDRGVIVKAALPNLLSAVQNDEIRAAAELILQAPDSEAVEKVANAIGTKLLDTRLSEPIRITLFRQIFDAITEENATSPAGKQLLGYCLQFLRTNWTRVEAYLKEHHAKLSLFRFAELAPNLANNLAQLLVRDQRLKDKSQSWLFESVFVWVLKSALQRKPDRENIVDLQNRIIDRLAPVLYKEELKQFSKMIFSDLPKLDAQDMVSVPQAEPKAVICNQDGYDDGVSISCIKGAPLKLDGVTPIGYNVHLPEGEIKAIYTDVYGGFEKKDRIKTMFKPNALNKLDRYLLSQGIAVVTLNLVNLRELAVPQNDMPSRLHMRLHESINKYFDALHNGTLDPQLTSLKGLTNFLYGASFGGRTAIKHAQKFPGTFTGYISYDGSLSYDALVKTRPAIVPAPGRWSNNVMDPAFEIEKIQDRVLLLHNFDDNNVNVAVTLGWYKQALSLGKGDLVRMVITHEGNPVPEDVEEIHNKGHYFPTDPESLVKIGSAIVRFMLEGVSALPREISELNRKSFELFAYRNMPRASGTKKFLSEAYRFYRANRGTIPIDDETWQTHYVPMYYAVSALTRLKTQKQPLYMEIKRLHDDNLLTEEVISNGLNNHAFMFAQFLKEKYAPASRNSVEKLAQVIVTDASIRETYRSWIENAANESSDFLYYIIGTLYLGNPNLLSAYFDFFKSQKHMQEKLTEAKKKFEESILILSSPKN